MGAFNERLTITYESLGSTVSAVISKTGNLHIANDFSIADGVSNQAHTIDFTAANLQAVWLFSSQNVTLKTNSSSSPQETISLVAGVPLFWTYGNGLTIPFAGNITKFYFTNASGSSANIQVRALVSD